MKFAAEPLISDLKMWVDSDDDLMAFPRQVLALATLALVPLFERGGERLHSVLQRGTEFKKVGGPFCSLVLRAAQLERRLASEPEYLSSLVGFVDRTRTATKICRALCITFEAHPLFQSSELQCTSKVVSKLLYRLDTC